MNIGEVSGERLFLLYAFPCAEIRLRRSLISQVDMLKLQELVDFNQEPEQKFLLKCFPNAVQSFVQKNGLSDTGKWSKQLVSNFWHDHEGQAPECRVFIAQIIHARTIGLTVQCKSTIKTIINRYNLPFETGDRVYVHQCIAVEKFIPEH